ncbi:hypothetical protein [Streptomyces sp. NPDC058193]|uniref:hypothetical protein n=1 Tax=Streptomyces sp. NPDC058193 TaxID=3346373 RepID=UPI0036E551E6
MTASTSPSPRQERWPGSGPPPCDLPDGHSLALVVNSRDALYSFAGTEGSTATISSPGDGGARLELPLG